MVKTVFDFKTYRSFFIYKTEQQPGAWGIKTKLSEAMGCQAAFLSQALKDKAELSLEQIYKACDFFHLDPEEKSFLILLHQKDRSGISELKKYFQEQISSILEKRLNLVERLQSTQQLNEKEKAIYYSSWIYAAIHMAVTISYFQTKEELRKTFKIKPAKFNEALQFLIETGLIENQNGKLKSGKTRIRLGNNSNWIIKHHTNWRLKAIENLENEDIKDFHYSGVLTLSESDALKIKDLLLDGLEKQLNIVDQSKEEKMFILNVDFFNLLKDHEQ